MVSHLIKVIDWEYNILSLSHTHYCNIWSYLSQMGNHNKIFEDGLSVEGKNLDLIDFETEGGWWKISGPKYGPAVEDSIEKLVFKLAQR